MNDTQPYGNTICSIQSTKMEGFDSLARLALDMRWSWNHAADELWQQLDPLLWEETHNPWLILQTIPGERLHHQLRSPGFRAKLDAIIQARDKADSSPAWFQQNHAGSTLHTVAYFSMEFMLSEALPIYVGGLGNVAGDQLKSASDLGVPVIGIGLLYQQGYFRQSIDKNGDQQAYLPYNDPGQLPVRPLRLANGEWLRIEISLNGYPMWLRAWQVRVGRVHLYLLDSNDTANLPTHREITCQLYGGGPEMRIKQEIALGIGGWRLLQALGIRPEVCHLNEGHAAFAVLERARCYMQESGANFEVALATTRVGNLFTTHTAVAAGFDHFDPALMADYFSQYAENELHISFNDLMALGRQSPGDASEYFNMAYLAIRGSGSINGVSRLHGRVSRHIFETLFYRWPTEEIPVGHVTNGVHMSSWDTEDSDRIWTQACGKERWMWETETLSDDILRISDRELWAMRNDSRKSLISYIRRRVASQRVAVGAEQEKITEAGNIFDPSILTIGFARRFVPYKRPDLLLHDPERLVRLLTNTSRPVQLIIAGKAPPADQSGKDLIKQWINFIRRMEISKQVIFLEDYDMLLAERMVGGIDVWLNTPQRPWEACGTSGMKVLVNGGLNLSELDGWWAEAYDSQIGWALGDGKDRGNDPSWDGIEAETLYKLLEEEVAPSFYERDSENIPTSWIQRVRKSMATLTPYFSSNRTVREYTENYYLPSSESYRTRAAENSEKSKRILSWKQHLDLEWPSIRFGELSVMSENDQHEFEVQVYLAGLDPGSVRVELFAQQSKGEQPFRQEMKPDVKSGEEVHTSEKKAGGYLLYQTTVPAVRPAGDYTPRIIPYHDGVSIPLENPKICWQR